MVHRSRTSSPRNGQTDRQTDRQTRTVLTPLRDHASRKCFLNTSAPSLCSGADNDCLRVSAAGRAALDAKGGPLRGLPHAGEDVLPQLRADGLTQPDRRRALALAERRRSDSGDNHIPQRVRKGSFWNVEYR